MNDSGNHFSLLKLSDGGISLVQLHQQLHVSRGLAVGRLTRAGKIQGTFNFVLECGSPHPIALSFNELFFLQSAVVSEVELQRVALRTR